MFGPRSAYIMSPVVPEFCMCHIKNVNIIKLGIIYLSTIFLLDSDPDFQPAADSCRFRFPVAENGA